jgi:DNA mismatch repair protein MutS
MRIDQDTLRDLEVQSPTAGGPGLLDHLNRTRTRGGREAFRRRLTHPLSTAREVRAVQDALRFIEANRAAFAALPTDSAIAELNRYLSSRVTTLRSLAGPALTVESWWIRVRYADIHQEATRGTQIVAAFLATVDELLLHLEDPPSLLAEYVREVRALLGSSQLRMLRTRAPRFSGTAHTLLLDSVARDSAKPALRRLIEIVFEVDALISMSDVTAEKVYTYPAVEEDFRGVELHDLYHPFLEKPVTNDLQLSPGVRLVFLTGPNMAGKSTYLKAVGVAVLLAHTGMGVPAGECRIGVLDRLVTAIRTEDNLHAGVSYFQAEARRVGEIARMLADGRRCLVIADELFRGTNVKDACDASLTVLEAFSTVANGRFIVASHLTELADSLEKLHGVLLRRFEAATSDEDLRFDYRIRAGVSTQRLGMRVLEREGVLGVLSSLRLSSQSSDRTAQGA